jgi:hypothetical protein
MPVTRSQRKHEQEKIEQQEVTQQYIDEHKYVNTAILLPADLAKDLVDMAQLEGVILDAAIQTALKELIADAIGVTRQEAEKPRNAWYCYETIACLNHIKGKMIDNYGTERTIKNTIRIQSQLKRKHIPLPSVADYIPYECFNPPQTKLLQAMVNIAVWRSTEALAEYFQMTLQDAILQAVERYVHRRVDARRKQQETSVNSYRVLELLTEKEKENLPWYKRLRNKTNMHSLEKGV